MTPASKIRLGIIGGAGRMGRWFKRQFEAEGYEVLVSDRNTLLSNRELAKACQVIFVSVPMSVFKDVVKDIGPFLNEDQGLIDFCSLKKEQNEIMLANTKAEVVAAHPLFGPGEKSLEGQKIALWPSRGQTWFNWFKNFLEQKGAKTVVVSPEEHDRTMAVVQIINHLMLLALGKLMDTSGLDLKLIKDLATPSFERQLEIVARFADQDPYLYALIQFDNPEGQAMREKYLSILEDLVQIAARKDFEKFVSLFKDVQKLSRNLKLDL
ncbi:Prephenate dehydrogenase [Thermodesulfatator indicus DSM 15286]|uniref:Prephenate dehydrogenase n=1 Tax=Thermodesulfatator indicus (strain DSM 15286 / JCM 11887 / CIR29812) TaxID=667014 RepID=F8AD81_THEID|nr:prephenate dehydrogenase/arogenate dehydrogenase family protein [Thermodesulfatator indicus]AEH44813.1 Prephenate dehydrogenase [Thermodesulfatator indicus DSM 15286]